MQSAAWMLSMSIQLLSHWEDMELSSLAILIRLGFTVTELVGLGFCLKGRKLKKHFGQYQFLVKEKNSAMDKPEHLKWVQRLQESQKIDLPSFTNLQHTEQI